MTETAVTVIAGPDRPRFGAHWTIFLPTAVVAVLYAAVWIAVSAAAGRDSDIARVFVIAAAVGVPLMFVHAYLRYASLGLLIGGDAVWYRHGWFRPRWKRLALIELAGVQPAVGLAARLFGGGALVLRLKDGRRLRIDDMALPGEAARLIGRRLRPLQRGHGHG